MTHDGPSSSAWRATSLSVLARGALLLVLLWVPGCELLPWLGGGPPPPPGECEALCELEDECGLRSYAACVSARRCDAEADADGGAPVPLTDADDCMLAVENCADVALCTCDDACARIDECTGSPDPSCAGTCESLVEQDVVGTFQENRCRIESTCEDLALCGGA